MPRSLKLVSEAGFEPRSVKGELETDCTRF